MFCLIVGIHNSVITADATMLSLYTITAILYYMLFFCGSLVGHAGVRSVALTVVANDVLSPPADIDWI